MFHGIYIIGKSKKVGLTKKTKYGLVDKNRNLIWLRLKRNSKEGYKFRPLRKVITTTSSTTNDIKVVDSLQ
jgi:hypothetical protein